MTLVDKFKTWRADVVKREAEAAKRNGVYVSRPVLNGEEWAAWAAAAGVPNPLAAADLHVTIVYSSVDVKMKPDTCPMVISVRSAVFAMFGPDEDNFVVAFQDWCLSDRHWTYLSNGAVSAWPTFRPHMTLSGDAKGFEVADDMLASAPEYIMLGAEVAGPVKDKTPPDEQDPEGVDEDEDTALILVVEIAMSAAATALETEGLSPIDRTALYDISKGRPVSVGVAKRLAGVAAEVSKALLVDQPADGRQERDVVLRVTPQAAEAIKKAKVDEVLKTDEESQLIYAISNVYSIGGQTVEDVDGDGFTTAAMEEFIAEVLKKEASGTFEHEGPLCNTVVQGIVMSDELQKALGIDLGFEALITATHFPDPENWAKAKQGDWEQSIRGRFWYED